jgi:hypothetical protein
VTANVRHGTPEFGSCRGKLDLSFGGLVGGGYGFGVGYGEDVVI